jgi:GNAT superfamily N-acetyltransferase
VTGPDLRPALPADTPALQEVFARSLWDYLARTGQLGPNDPREPPFEALRDRFAAIFGHLERTASHAWLAEDADGRVVGYARSVEREGHVELTEFFVDPAAQGAGVGRGLLERTFPLGWGRHRSILALLDARAVALYLRFGVQLVDTFVDLDGRPERIDVATDLVVETVGPGRTAERAIVEVERQVLGFDRTVDVRFLLAERPAWLLRRGRAVAGYGFGAVLGVAPTPGGPHVGPVATLDPADLATAVDLVIDDAAARGAATLPMSVPLSQGSLVRHLLGRGFKIDPFYVLALADAPVVDFARYLPTNPSFIL